MSTEIVNVHTGELTEKEKPTPHDLLMNAREAARALQDVIGSNARPPVMFNGKAYLEYPHWQTIATFYNCTIATPEAAYVEIGGIVGFKAIAKVIDQGTGLIVGEGVAYCMKDEPNWKTKPLFQLASMAQTRAGAKALSNKFRYVAIVAGYEPTPSEEIADQVKPGIGMPKEKAHDDKPRIDTGVPGSPEIEFGGPTQTAEDMDFAEPEKKSESKFFKKLHQVAREKGLESEKVKAAIRLLYGKESSKDLDDKQCSALIKQIEMGAIKNGD